MGEAISNESIVLILDPPSVSGVITIISVPSIGVKAGGSGIYSGPLMFSCSALIQAPCGTATPGTLPMGAILPTAISVMVDSLPVIREKDEIQGLVSVGATQPSSPSPIPCVIVFGVKVQFAGQLFVKGD